MSDTLIFRTTDGETLRREVARGTGEGELKRFLDGEKPYGDEWVPVDEHWWARREAIVSVHLVPETEPLIGLE